MHYLCTSKLNCPLRFIMKELKCPKCGHVFHVDQEMFDSLANQVKTIVFNEEIERRTDELRRQVTAEAKVEQLRDRQNFKDEMTKQERVLGERDIEIARLKEQLDNIARNQKLELESQLNKKNSEYAQSISDKDKIIASLKAELEQGESKRQVAVLEEQRKALESIKLKDEEIHELKNRVDAQMKEAQIRESGIKEQYAMVIKQKDETIEYYKDMKTRMSTKMIGETLEIHCQTLFQQAQSMGMFPDAFFEKDNDVRTGTKGDFIFRDYDCGREYISIMFEMKNEADATVTKHRNTDFLEKLDKDRRDKECEYAVLVSLLERDNDLYNDGIVNMSHKYPKMYVVRPQMFMPLISLLSQAARKNIQEMNALRVELEVARAQTIDVTNFEKRRDQFVANFSKLVEAHAKKHEDAMTGIDKVIDALEKQVDALRKVKNLFDTSEQKLIRANETVENDFTIKKLTHGNPTMRAKFNEARTLQKNDAPEE